jgi:hypothetical protein
MSRGKKMNFENIIEEVKLLPFEMKQQLKQLLEKYLIEERCAEIHKNYKKSQKEYKAGKFQLSGDIQELKRML